LDVGGQKIVAENSEYRQLLVTSLKLAEAGVSTILILGDSGTGKGLLAKLVHKASTRKSKPFVEINCAAVPTELIEAEFFGYEPGAFTCARKEGKAGLFEMAEGGTLFLDEIGDLPLALQAKLLTYLDDFHVRRLGATRAKRVACHVIAATNCDLAERVREGRFREDLLFRINAFTLKVPPLRSRPEDLWGLISNSLEIYNSAYDKNRRVTPSLIERLRAYPFPGNVRELKNIMKRAVVLSDSDTIDDTVMEIVGQGSARLVSSGLKEQMARFEKQLLVEAMARCDSTRALGEHLGIDQSNVVRKLKKHGLTLRET
jgi:transcriptional regulator with PAS, ATPase and Fis domain